MQRENFFQDGPYVNAAFLCERVLDEKDNVKSAIRIVDRIINRASGPGASDQMPPLPWRFALFLRLKTGNRPGKHELKLRFVLPDGGCKQESSFTVDFEEGADRGADITINVDLVLEKEGLHWFELYCNEVLMTKVPLRVLYLIQKQSAGDQPAPVIQ